MTVVPESPTAGERRSPGLRQRAMMLLPVALPLIVYALIRIGDSSRAGLVLAGIALAVVAVGGLLVGRRRDAEEPQG